MKNILILITVVSLSLLVLVGVIYVYLNPLDPGGTVSNNPINKMSNQQLDELKPVVKKLFIEYLDNEEKPTVSAERRIKNFIVQDDIQILKNDQNTYFIVTYDTLAASKEYVIAGGGELNEDGWLKKRELHVVIQKTDGEYQIKQLSSGP
jgi:hypothetical protein